MKTCIVFTLLLLSTSLCLADCSEWYQGKVYLQKGEVLEGNIKYCLDHDLVMIERQVQVLTFSPVSVEQFLFFDPDMKLHRRFFALYIEEQETYERQRFFELLYDGRISLLSRSARVLATEEEVLSGQLISHQMWKIVDNFYLLDAEGKLRPFSGSAKELYRYLGKEAAAVSSFVSKNKLDTYTRTHLITILDYYHRFQDGSHSNYRPL